jgi:HK97 family phage major capsid protein
MKKKLEELRQRYNTACENLQRSADAIENAAEGTNIDELRTAFDTAETEARSAKESLDHAERIATVRTAFKPLASTPAPTIEDPTHLNMDERDLKKYSIVRAISAAAAFMQGDARAWNEASLEREASDAISERLGRRAKGFYVPNDVQVEKRDLSVGTDSAGGYTVSTDLLAGSFIDMLRNRMAVRQAGATVLSGLVGDIAIPRQTGGATGYWVAESGAPTESQQTVDQVTLAPKTCGAFTDISRKLLLQSSIDVENFVRTDLATVLALLIDLAALHGTGSANQPTGIAATSGIGSVAIGTNGGAPTWAAVVGLETEVATDNADIGKLAYITNAKVRGKMKVTPKVSSTDSIMLWENNNSPINGYPALCSNQVSSTLTKGSSTSVCSAAFFGNWADLVIGMWGVLDVLVDPFTGGTSGTVRVITLQDVDVAVRHAQSFAACLDLTTT